MTTVAPPPPAPPPAPGGPSLPTTVTVPDAPEALLRLPVGTSLDVSLVNTALRNAVEADSALGRLLLRTPLPLPEGAEATLQLVSVGRTQAILRLVTLGGKPLSLALSDLLSGGRDSRPAPILPPPSPPQAGQSPASLLTGGGDTVSVSAQGRLPGTAPNALMQAVVLRPGNALAQGLTTPGPGMSAGNGGLPPTPVATLAALSGLKTNSIMTVRLVGIGLSHTPATPAAPLPPGTTGTPTATTTAGNPQTGASTTPGTGTPSPAPASSAPATPTAPPAVPPQPRPAVRPLMLSGLMTGDGMPGQPMLRTAVGLLALNGGPPLPTGTRVTIEVLGQQPPLPSASPGPSALPPGVLPLPGTAGAPATIVTLTQSLEQIGRQDLEAATRLMSRLPADDPRLLLNAVSFVQAARNNDARGWLGQRAVQALNDSGPHGKALLGRLTEEMQPRLLAARDGAGGDWRVLQMPFMVGGTIERIALITRREGGQDDAEDDGKGRRRKDDPGQRFLVDLTLSRLGPLQLDGLYKTKGRTFDLVIRTNSPWPHDLKQGLLGVYARAAQTLNLTGSVSFQVTEVFPGPEMPSSGTLAPTHGWIA